MIKIAVVDDEKILLKKIGTLIEKHIMQDKEISYYDDSSRFFNSVEKLSFDAVFLDIDMPDINGFVIAGDLKCIKPDMAIIFVSNKENLVIDSIRFKPVAFIRKSNMEQDIINNLDLILKSVQSSVKYFCLEINECNTSISLNDIIYFETLNHDLFIQTLYNSYRKKRDRNNELSLKKLYSKYSADGFILVSRNYLLNYRFIDVIGNDKILLKNNTKIDISPRNVTEIKRIYQQLLMKGVSNGYTH